MNSLLFYTLCVAMCCVAGLFSVLYKQGRFALVIVSAFAARLIGAVIFMRVVGTADISDYQPYFAEFVQALDSGTVLSFLGEGVPFYTAIFPGWVFAALGPDSYFVIRLFNAMLSVSVIVPLNIISEEVWGRELKRWQLLLVLFWPSYLILSVDVGRTAFGVVLPLATIALALKYFRHMDSISILGGFTVVSVMNAANRIHYAFYLVMFLVGMFAYKAVYQSFKWDGVAISVTAGIITGGAILVYNRLFINILSVTTIQNYAEGQATGGSVYLPELFPASFLDLVWYLPIQAFYFLFSPVPWDLLRIGSPLAIIAGMQSILLLMLVIPVLLRCKSAIISDWRIVALLTAIVLTAIGFGSVTKNAGAAVRWRLPSALLLIIITTNLLRDTNYNFGAVDSESNKDI